MKTFFYHKSRNLITKTLATTSLFILSATLSLAQQKSKDSLKVNQLNEVFVKPTRVDNRSPFAFSDFSKTEIADRNLGQDIPILLNYLPSVVTTSDAGNGFGYTGLRVRGSDATRVNVTINGIPFNDSESQSSYFVDMPDFASSLESVQLQRGVGTSTNGTGAFGASLNMLTNNYSEKSNGEISNAFGSFNSRKHTVKFSTGLMNNRFEISGRLSNLHSDGYIDRAFSDLKGYFLQGAYVGKTTLIKAITFGGTERTYQAYFGIDAATLNSNRTENFAGLYYDANGNKQYYSNQTDNYQQDHYQLHWNEKISRNWNTNLAFHYTKGIGYYESYRNDEKTAAYNGILPTKFIADDNGNLTEPATDLIDQKWLDNDFYGTTFSANFKNEKLDLILGGSTNKYEGKHYGKVIWSRSAGNTELGQKYYDDFATKTDAAFFAKATIAITKKLNLFADLQYRSLNYKANFNPNSLVNDNFNFLNPKAGINYAFDKFSNVYFSFAKANKEPNRTDYENGNPKPEALDDYELGYRFANNKTQINLNFFYMLYQNQLVLTGALDGVGNPIRINVGQSYRLGIEVDANIKFAKKWTIRPNITISENKNIDFITTNGTDVIQLGNTTIAYSPKIVAGNTLTLNVLKNFEIATLSKFVGEQFLSNTEDQNAKLKDYFIQDFYFKYTLHPVKIFSAIEFTLLANNIFNAKYVSNGADYGGGYVYYFPQAGSNFMAGMNLKF